MTNAIIDYPQDSHFPLQNLPFGVFCPKPSAKPRVGVALGDRVLDMQVLQEAGVVTCPSQNPVFASDSLNDFIHEGPAAWSVVRSQLTALLQRGSKQAAEYEGVLDQALHPMDSVSLCLPVNIGDYTDFYASEYHAANVGCMFRDKDNPLLPNWKHIPVGYHGRASSVLVSGEPVYRPHGQILNADGVPEYAACRRLDFELESAFFVGQDNPLGQTIAIGDAEQHIFGLVVMNDWSARDIQKWEYVPLGPFLGKSFATTISPWVVMLDALSEFRCAGPEQDPTPLPYLQQNLANSHYNIQLSVQLQTEKMQTPETICETNHQFLYWSIAQQLTHHASNGCNLRVGDLLASGTISGPLRHQFGSLLEISWAGQTPLQLSSGETRVFLEDFDTVIMSGFCQAEGYRIGFGEVRNQILPRP